MGDASSTTTLVVHLGQAWIRLKLWPLGWLHLENAPRARGDTTTWCVTSLHHPTDRHTSSESYYVSPTTYYETRHTPLKSEEPVMPKPVPLRTMITTTRLHFDDLASIEQYLSHHVDKHDEQDC